MFFIFSETIRGILGLLISRPISSLLSPVSNLQQGLDWIFGQPSGFDIHPLWSLLTLGAMLAVCTRILVGRVRPVEVVS